MRPVKRGNNPTGSYYDEYGEALPYLQGSIGFYCSYCERQLDTGLHVEHIQPKTLYPWLEGDWDNFLLACVNCNSTKGIKNVALAGCYLPDRDNTARAFEYLADGTVRPASTLNAGQRLLAQETIDLTGLDRRLPVFHDANGDEIARDRKQQRMEAWGIAQHSLRNLGRCPTKPMQHQIVRTAVAKGFFSIWMTVFAGEPRMLRLFIYAFQGTCRSCFDRDGVSITTPRAASTTLIGSGKI